MKILEMFDKCLKKKKCVVYSIYLWIISLNFVGAVNDKYYIVKGFQCNNFAICNMQNPLRYSNEKIVCFFTNV